MSFICTSCEEPQENGTKPIKRVLETRDRKYFNEFQKWDKKKRKMVDVKIHIGDGTEIVREGQFCEPCDPQPEEKPAA